MSSVVSHAEMRELLGAYALHAMDDDESRLIEAHLERCVPCRTEVAEFLDVAASLAVGDEMPLSAAVHDRILSEVRATTGGRSGGDGDGLIGIADVIRLDAAAAARRGRLKRGLRGWRGAAVAAVAAAATVAPITATVTGSSSPSLAALAERAASEPGAVTVPLRDASGREVARAVLTASGRGYVVDDSLPSLAAGSTYQLWAVTGEKPVSAGVLGRDPGVAAFTVDSPTSALAISVEPTIGSSQPSADPIAAGTVDRA